MTLQQQCLPESTRASDYAALLAALPDVSNGAHGLPGGWLITVEIEGDPPQAYSGIFLSDIEENGGQYCETSEQGNLEGPFGFGTWHMLDPVAGTFELTFQTPLCQEAETAGWTQTTYSGHLIGPGSFSGSGSRTAYTMQGESMGTQPVIVKAHRHDVFPDTVQN